MLRERYEQIRERALQRTAISGSDVVMRRGMKSWIETGWQEEFAPEIAPVVTAPKAGGLLPDQGFQQMVAVWASVFMDQAERSYSGQREA